SLLERLAKIESYSGREGEMASFILSYLESLGYEALIDCSNVLVLPEKEFIIATHMDTFRLLSQFTFDGEYAYGTGVCDAKASIAAILLALKRIGFKELNFGVAFFCDEEGDGRGSMDFCRKYKPKMAVVMEPTDMAIANIQYGGLEITVKARGIAAHGATPHMGRNAIEECIKAVSNLMGIDEAIISVQYISGGSPEDFAIPEECEARVELIFKPEIEVEEILAKIRGILRSENLEIIVKEAYNGFIGSKVPEILRDAINIVGYTARFSNMPSWTDAVNLHEHAGCDVAIFGPGELHLCHTRNERVRIRDIILAADTLVALNNLLEKGAPLDLY
ncbi:MAG: M20/M25/M40 family metallo-hydrolase, partial [Candidatus Bathyarchaeia archaeon]